MFLITKRFNIQNVAKRWKDQYQRYNDADKMRKLAKLEALDPDKATEDDVTKIIGNISWTEIKCDECQQSTDAAMILGSKTDNERTVTVCMNCVIKAYEQKTFAGY